MVSICFSSAGRWPWEEVWMRGEEVRGRGGGMDEGGEEVRGRGGGMDEGGGGEGPGRRYG